MWERMETLLLSWIYYYLISYCVGCSAAGVFKKMQTLCTLYLRHTCSMCMRSKAAQSVQNNTGTSFRRINIFCISLIVVFFILHDNTLLQCVVHAFRSPCNMNASTGKQPKVTFPTGIYTPMAAEERSILIWRPNDFMNSCQL